MKKIILFQVVVSEQVQSSYPLPEIYPEKIEILNQHVFEEVYQDQSASEGQ